MTYEEWQSSVPTVIREDTLWNVKAYRLALFLSDLAWEDATKLNADKRTQEISGQLVRATGKVSAHICEGYSRNTGKERSRYYEYALGSTRESRDWYYKGRHILGSDVMRHRLELATDVIRLVLTMASNERRSNRKIIREK